MSNKSDDPLTPFGDLIPFGFVSYSKLLLRESRHLKHLQIDPGPCFTFVRAIPVLFVFANSDPNWYQGWHSPYYNKTHVELRAYTRTWVDKHIAPFCHEWDEARAIPRNVFVDLAKVQ